MGALLDHGLDRADLTGFFPLDYQTPDVHEVAANVNHGITTTTPADARVGAANGAGVGLGVGVMAAMACLIVPGFGVVTGGSAVLTAMAAVAGSALCGAITGAVAGFLEDQGVDTQISENAQAALKNGDAFLIAHGPSGPMEGSDIEKIMCKYRGEVTTCLLELKD
jgi:hypothetical protein